MQLTEHTSTRLSVEDGGGWDEKQTEEAKTVQNLKKESRK